MSVEPDPLATLAADLSGYSRPGRLRGSSVRRAVTVLPKVDPDPIDNVVSPAYRGNRSHGISGSPGDAACSTEECLFCKHAKAHHDRLLTVDRDLAALIELFELAVTWGELDYSHQCLVEPAWWSEFVATHRWQDVVRAEQIFGLATDVALRSKPPNFR